jgi:5-methylcytosine-specific restriction enzyme A
MLTSCKYCMGVHPRGFNCTKKPPRTKFPSDITKFRGSRLWKKKSQEIRKRDKYLCQVCLKEMRYTFRNLEVHHIVPIAKNWDLKLENTNLITLCIEHHKLADNGSISPHFLDSLAYTNQKNPD